jgi:hypothetical protein
VNLRKDHSHVSKRINPNVKLLYVTAMWPSRSALNNFINPFFFYETLLHCKVTEPSSTARRSRLSSREKNTKLRTTLNNGYLGSRNDEERSEMRYVMRIAQLRESSNLWTQIAVSGRPDTTPLRVSVLSKLDSVFERVVGEWVPKRKLCCLKDRRATPTPQSISSRCGWRR